MPSCAGVIGAMPATVNDGLWGTPATRHEAACASGSAALLAAVADLPDLFAAVGLQVLRTTSGRRPV